MAGTAIIGCAICAGCAASTGGTAGAAWRAADAGIECTGNGRTLA